MPEERPVRSAELSVYSYATEDEEKVKKAVTNILGEVEPEFEEEKLTGHYEDPITVVSVKVDQRKDATSILARVYTRLSSLDQTQLTDELPDRVDPSGNLYLRLDKQKAYNGKIALSEVDPIRIKFKMQPPHKADPVVFVRNLLTEIGEDGAAVQ